MPANGALLDRLLDPVGSALGVEVARRMLELKPDPEMQRQVDELAERANDGSITDEQRSEYESLIAAATVIGVLKAKARVVLASHSA